MNTLRLHLHFSHPNLSNTSPKVPLIIPIKPKSKLIFPSPSSSGSSHVVYNSKTSRNLVLEEEEEVESFKNKRLPNEEFSVISSKGHSRTVILGAMSLGLAALLMGLDDHKALALGPEGPLVEEFWDNMRRYALYALTVSTGAISVLLEPIIELLKNPISAVLIIIILGGSFFIVSQVVTAMVGLSDFSYEYSY